jgi:1-acyl-sn-glycerol-3-phosphate acyltransferase
MWSKIRSAYAWVLLSVIVLPLFPVATLFEAIGSRWDPRQDRLRVLIARWVSVYGWLTPLYRFEIHGREHLPRDSAYVMVANHESGLDTLALLMLGTPARFIAESYLFRIPLNGALFRRSRQIPVEIGDRESGRQALAIAERAIAEGTPIAIFPEGHLSPDTLAPFRPGAFVLAQRAGVPLIPIVIEGAGRAWRPGTLVVKGRHIIRINVLEPIPADETSATDPGELLERVRKTFVERQCRV